MGKSSLLQMYRVVEEKKISKLERFNMCVNDISEEEVCSNPILLIHKLLIQESELPDKEAEILEGRF